MTRKRTSGGGVVAERDLTELARSGRLAAGHGIEADVDALCQLLGRSGHHLLLSGEPGTGKTARIHEVARRVAAGTAGAPLVSARVVEVSLQVILASGGEARCVALFGELLEGLEKAAPLSVVLLRDASTVLGTPLLPSLASALRSSSLRFVLEAEPRRT